MAQLLANSGLPSPLAIDNLAWINSIQTVGGFVYRDANVAISLNSDGTYTQMWSAVILGNLTYSAAGVLTGGTINWVIHSTSSSPTLPPQIERVDGNGGALLGLNANTFWNSSTNSQRFASLFNGNDTLNGNNSTDDVLTGGAGSDVFNGGGGNDTASYSNAAAGVYVNLVIPSQNLGDALGDTYNSIENLRGSNFSDVLGGTAGTNVISGGGGDDTIVGQGGADTLQGEAGRDTYLFDTGQVAAGLTIIDGDATTRDVLNTSAASTVNFTPASITGVEDLVIGNGGTVTLSSGQIGGPRITLVGGNSGTTEQLIVNGTTSVDMSGMAFSNWTRGTDTITLNLTGAAGSITGSAQNEIMNGTAGDDFFESGGGDDRIFGGNGNDTIYYNAAGDTVVSSTTLIAGGGGTDTVVFGSPFTPSAYDFTAASFFEVEKLVFGTDGATGVYTVATFNSSQVGIEPLVGLISGISSTATIQHNDTSGTRERVFFQFQMANGGNLDLSGMTFVGFDDNDKVNINGTGTWLASTITGSTQNDFIEGGAGDNTINGGGGVDTIYGYNGNDTLAGGAGNDFLYGGAGNDNISGDGGADYMAGGLGDDRYVVDTYAGEAVAEFANEGIDVVYATIDYTIGLNIEQMIMVDGSACVNAGGSSGNDTIIGNSANNVIYGYAGDDTLSGGAGNDSIVGAEGNDNIDGGTGNDTMIGGIGDDRYVVDSVQDVVAENVGEGTDVVYASISYTIGGNVEQLILIDSGGAINGAGDNGDNVVIGNSSANLIYGNDGNDTLYGFGGTDSLVGGIGNDVLIGGIGNDSLVGGSGSDLFQFSVGDGIDTVQDFQGAQGDILRISSALSASFADIATNHASVVGGNVVLSWNGGAQSITLVGVSSVSSLQASNVQIF